MTPRAGSRLAIRDALRPALREAIMGGFETFHPTAVARIDAIITAGGIIPVGAATAKRLLSDFIIAEDLAGRWSDMKRLYLPGFGNAAANAIDIVGGTSGTFPVSGGVTHATGYVQGNGSTGYFNFGVTPSALGLTLSSAAVFALVTQSASGTSGASMVTAVDGTDTNKVLEISHQSTTVAFRAYDATLSNGTVQPTLARASQVGIFVGSREGGNRRVVHRLTSGVSTLINTAGGNFGSVPTTGTLQAMRSSFGSGAAYSNGRYGAYGASMGMTVAQAQAFSANLKTLWEGLFNLTLP